MGNMSADLYRAYLENPEDFTVTAKLSKDFEGCLDVFIEGRGHNKCIVIDHGNWGTKGKAVVKDTFEAFLRVRR